MSGLHTKETYTRFKSFHTQGRLLDPAQPAQLMIKMLQGEWNGEIVSIYNQHGQDILNG